MKEMEVEIKVGDTYYRGSAMVSDIVADDRDLLWVERLRLIATILSHIDYSINDFTVDGKFVDIPKYL